MNHRQAVIATLKREPAEFVPGWSFFSTQQAEKLLLPDLHADGPDDYQIKFAQATGSSLLMVSGGLQGHVVEEREDSHIVELDNGTRRLIVSKPEWFYQTLSRPMDGHYDLDKLKLPDPNSYPKHWEQVKRSVQRFHEAGYFVRGHVDGFYAGLWEHCRCIEDVLMDLAEDTEFAERLVNKWGAFLYESAGKLVVCGVDCLWWTDDLGSNTGPVMSPYAYRKYFFPWHKRTVELAHQNGKFALMHCHGNINLLLPDIVATGIDVLDPVGPSDGMNLKQLKETYGNRLSFSGGISRFIADMSIDQLRAHLEEVYSVGSRGGGFFPNEEGGVPRDMAPANYRAYLQIRGELSRKYAQR